jgi:hypothetical protein
VEDSAIQADSRSLATLLLIRDIQVLFRNAYLSSTPDALRRSLHELIISTSKYCRQNGFHTRKLSKEASQKVLGWGICYKHLISLL